MVVNWGTGRKDYSQNVEVSVTPVVRSHQTRAAWATAAAASLSPDDEWFDAKLFPISFRGRIVVISNFRVHINTERLVLVHIGKFTSLDDAVEEPLRSDYVEVDYGSKYGYGKVELNLRQGLTFNVPSDASESKYYNGFLNFCPFVSLINKTNDAFEVTRYEEITGMTDKEPWWK